ncbi:hypothetical protein DXG03_005766, partial [Asterophora parasitica]
GDTRNMDRIKIREALNYAQARLARVLLTIPPGTHNNASSLSRLWRAHLATFPDDRARLQYAVNATANHPDKPSPELLEELCKLSSTLLDLEIERPIRQYVNTP